MSMVDYHTGPTSFHLPQRRPLPQLSNANPRMQSLDQQQYSSQQYSAASQSQSKTASSAHFSTLQPNTVARPIQNIQAQPSMTSSSQSYAGYTPHNTNPVSYQAHLNQYNSDSSTRRTLSNATTSTSSTGGDGGVPARKNSAGSSTLARSTSSRSGTSPTSYVALMRKQKATVWCERAQHEDPRHLAAIRAAKARAANEISSSTNPHNITNNASNSNNYSITGGVRSKIRHHGAPKAQQYAPAALHLGSGVPMRLSANEVDEEESDEDSHAAKSEMHRRSGSGRSSLGSTGRGGSGYGPGVGGGTPPSGRQSSPLETRHGHRRTELHVTSTTPEGTREDLTDGTPVHDEFGGAEFFIGVRKTNSGNSGSTGSSERENSFGGVGMLPLRTRVGGGDAVEKEDPAELRRRGSVDERTMTMSGFGRLFVANPDVE